MSLKLHFFTFPFNPCYGEENLMRTLYICIWITVKPQRKPKETHQHWLIQGCCPFKGWHDYKTYSTMLISFNSLTTSITCKVVNLLRQQQNNVSLYTVYASFPSGQTHLWQNIKIQICTLPILPESKLKKTFPQRREIEYLVFYS